MPNGDFANQSARLFKSRKGGSSAGSLDSGESEAESESPTKSMASSATSRGGGKSYRLKRGATHPPAYWIEMAPPSSAMEERVDQRWYHQATACIKRCSPANKDPAEAQRLQRHVKLMTHCENMQFALIVKLDAEELAASVGAVQKALVKWAPRALFSFVYNVVYALLRRLDQGITEDLCEEFFKATVPLGESDHAFHLKQPLPLRLFQEWRAEIDGKDHREDGNCSSWGSR